MVSLEVSNCPAICTRSAVPQYKSVPFRRRKGRTGATPTVIAGPLPGFDLLGIAGSPALEAREDWGGILRVLAASVRPDLFAAGVGQRATLVQHAQAVPPVPRSGILSLTVGVFRIGPSARHPPLFGRTSCLDSSPTVLRVVFEPLPPPSVGSSPHDTALLWIAAEPLSLALLSERHRISPQSLRPSRRRSATDATVALGVFSVVSDPAASTRLRSPLLLTKLSCFVYGPV